VNRCYETAALLLLAVPLYAQSDLAFPQLAVGGTPAYETVLQLVNEVENNNPIVIEVYQGRLSGTANGTPLAVRFDGGSPSTSYSITLAPYQELTTVITGDPGTLKNGWLRVRSTLTGGKISGNLVFRQRSGSSLTDSVGATTPQRFRQAIVQVDQRESGSDTGVAFANPDDTAVEVMLDLFQGTNRVAAPLPVTLQPKQHFARLISEMFPSFGSRQGTLVIGAAAGRAVPCMALRLDGGRLTSIPVRPLGFAFQYTVTNDAGSVLETGVWMFDLLGFDLIGTGKVETPAPSGLFEVTGSWLGTNFQFRYRKSLAGNTTGMMVFNGTSAGPESTVDASGKGRVISGKATLIGADGQVVSVNRFTAYHKFGAPPAP